MKLHEYLKQFEGLDPNMEVYGYDSEELSLLEKKVKFTKIAFVGDDNLDDPLFVYYYSKIFNKKVLIIS